MTTEEMLARIGQIRAEIQKLEDFVTRYNARMIEINLELNELVLQYREDKKHELLNEITVSSLNPGGIA